MIKRWLVATLVILSIYWGHHPAVLAHGGGTPQLTNEPAGPYLISAWTNPDPAIIGESHITVSVADAADGSAVTAAGVRVVASSGDGTAMIESTASTEDALTPYVYESDLVFPAAGSWQITIFITGDQGDGRVAFPLNVVEGSPNWLLIGMAGILVAIIGWLGWMLMQGGKKPRSQRARGLDQDANAPEPSLPSQGN